MEQKTVHNNTTATAANRTQDAESPVTLTQRLGRGGVNLCRLVLGLVFVFSGFVKAIDPLGTQYKIQDYLTVIGLGGVVPDLLTLGTSVVLAAVEFCLGIFILFAIRRRLCSKIMLVFMVGMTLVSLWLVLFNPVTDCGCFGDAIRLTNTQTLLKNLVLMVPAIVLWRWPLKMYRFISETNQWIAINFTILFIFITSIYCLYRLPIFDFRPYHIGANIKKGMEIPEGAEQPKFVTTFIMEKDGVRKEFGLDDYPDSTWQFVDSKTMQISEGFVPPIHDFSIQAAEGDDITDTVLSRRGYTFLLISPHLENADDSNFGAIDYIYEYAQEQKIPFYCLTASTERAIKHWEDITGAEYPFYMTDATALKTIIRSNPGLLLLKDGVVIGKWGHNNLPKADVLQGPLEKTTIGHMPNDSIGKTLTQVLLWFFLPLIFLSLADRTWAWSRYVRLKIRKEEAFLEKESEQIENTSNKIISTFKKEKQK